MQRQTRSEMNGEETVWMGFECHGPRRGSGEREALRKGPGWSVTLRVCSQQGLRWFWCDLC